MVPGGAQKVLIGEGKLLNAEGIQKSMKPVACIKQICEEQWPTASDHREYAERAARILRIMVSANRPPERSIPDGNRGALLDTYG